MSWDVFELGSPCSWLEEATEHAEGKANNRSPDDVREIVLSFRCVEGATRHPRERKQSERPGHDR